jgi:NADPH:quinone reductase-like Zn-dependent oxidoreductase
MRAIRVHESGGIDTMRLDEIPRPVPEARELLVAVKAAGVGPWDRLVREGRSGLGQKLPVTLGSEISGTVAALGTGVGGFALGDAVYGATNNQFVGGYAEYALVEANKVALKPAALDYVTAAGLPVVAVTAWQMLFEYARIAPGQAILVRGAAGSVGACATQMAKQAGASVYGTARVRDIERVRALGAEPVVEGDQIGAQSASKSLDAVIDTIGGDALESTSDALRPNGIIVSVVRAPDAAYLSVERRARGVFHRRRHARPARQDLGDGRARRAQPAGRRGSRPCRREHRPPHAGWRPSQARENCAQRRRLTGAARGSTFRSRE